MTVRKYQSRSQKTALASALAAGATSMTVNSGSLLVVSTIPSGATFAVVIDPDTSLEEIVEVINWSSGNTLTINRGIDGSSDIGHSAGAVVRHMAIGRDHREANDHSENITTAHGITLANIVKTTDTGTVTGTMIADNTIENADIKSTAAIAYSKLNLAGGIVTGDIANNTILDADINASAGIALSKLATDPLARANHTGTQLAATVSDFNTAVRTNRLDQLAVPTADVSHNGYKITSLADPVSAQDAATKAYVGAQITALVGGAPGTLDTLGEIATAINSSGTFATSVVLRDGTQAMTGALAMGTNKITGLGTPTATTDAATKAYADSIVATAPGNLTGPITSSGVATSIASQTGTGSKFVVDTSPTLVTPVLGVATATSVNGTTIPTSKTLVDTTNTLAVMAATTSAQLAGVISDETGSGALVFGTGPTITPAEGTTTTAANAGYMGIPQNATTTGAYTITAADNGKHIYCTATRTLTIDSNANLALPKGFAFTVVANSGVTVTIAITTDTMYLVGPGTTGSRTLAAFGMATFLKTDTTKWMASGNGLT